jgi:FKBP-type peptidyl-prolyl cis-trans isomerase FkpA
MWRNLASLDLSAEELDTVMRGLRDASAGGEPAIAVDEYMPKIQAFARERQTRRAEAEKAKGATFLETAATEPGASKTESGMVYRELVAGAGPSPSPSDTVRVHYRGTLVDGTEFDSSYERGEPAQFALDRVVKCWTEGLQKMKAGGKAKLVCPSTLAYGDRGRPQIPPGATLVFEIELLEIVSPDGEPE